jgi:hypothetical protein
MDFNWLTVSEFNVAFPSVQVNEIKVALPRFGGQALGDCMSQAQAP